MNMTKSGDVVQEEYGKGIKTTLRIAFITYISPELHVLKILWGHEEERCTEPEITAVLSCFEVSSHTHAARI